MTGATVSNWTAFSRRHDDAYRSRPEDATATYPLDLTGLAPQPKQGVHVKLTVHVPGTKGAGVKHKGFWVKPCATTPPGSIGEPVSHGCVRVPDAVAAVLATHRVAGNAGHDPLTVAPCSASRT